MHIAEPASPTSEVYGALQFAYDFFNSILFGGMLPPCIITLQRKGGTKRRTFGFYASQRFGNSGGAKRDEIALNPKHFRHRSPEEILATLVHEMAHLWQFHFGKPSRSGYHNREWAEKMFWLGLAPSQTGKPGGRPVGQQMTHYIAPGGRFEQAVKELLTSGFEIPWFDVDGVAPITGTPLDPAPLQSGKRTKFACGCGQHAWGKPSLDINCNKCERQMLPEGL
jgi:hypothetical protein